MDSKQQVQQLQHLQKQWADAGGVYDRWGRAEDKQQLDQLQAQIDAFPQEIRELAYCDAIRQELTYFVEAYQLRRAAHFLDEPIDLKATLMNLVDNSDPLLAGNLRLQRIANGLSSLRKAETLDEDLDIAIELAKSFAASRAEINQTYRALERFAREYLDDRERFLEATQPKGLGKLFGGKAPQLRESDDLRQAVLEWHVLIPEFRQNPAEYDQISSDPAIRIKVARRRLLSNIAYLRHIGIPADEIDKRLFDIQSKWDAKRPKG